MKSAIVAILGRPNAGKSTLLNALVGQKLAAVSAKPQTTRGRVRGILTAAQTQLVFCDTPGLHRSLKKRTLNTIMNSEAWNGAKDADIAIYLINLSSGFHEEDRDFLAGVEKELGERKLLLLASQADRFKYLEVQQALNGINAEVSEFLSPETMAQGGFKAMSAKRPEDLATLVEQLTALAPEGEWLYPEDDVSDQPVRVMAAELIRENIFRCLGEEIPYQVAVLVETWEETPTMTTIGARVLVARESLKPIVIGKGGAKIKEIGTLSRTTLERELDTKIFLQLSVGLSADWMEDEDRVRAFHGM